MIGVVIVTHGRLADELLAALEHVVGPQDACRTVAIAPNDDMEQKRAEIASCADAVDQGDGVIICTDMFGGTPSNLAISILSGRHMEVLAGANLPMLVKLATSRVSAPLEQAAEQACDAGRRYISPASQLLKSAGK